MHIHIYHTNYIGHFQCLGISSLPASVIGPQLLSCTNKFGDHLCLVNLLPLSMSIRNLASAKKTERDRETGKNRDSIDLGSEMALHYVNQVLPR